MQFAKEIFLLRILKQKWKNQLKRKKQRGRFRKSKRHSVEGNTA